MHEGAYKDNILQVYTFTECARRRKCLVSMNRITFQKYIVADVCVCVCVCVLVWLLMSTYCCLFKLLVKLHCRFDVHTLKTCWWWKNSYFFESVHIHALTNSSHITENISNFNYSIGIKAPLFCSFAQSFGSPCITARSVYILPESRWQERKQERKQ